MQEHASNLNQWWELFDFGRLTMDPFVTLMVFGALVFAVCLGMLIRFMYHLRGVFNNYNGPERIDGKTVIITGGNQGIGKATALELARRGGNIIIGDRHLNQSTIDEIIQETDNKQVKFIQLDLGSFAVIHRFVKEVYTHVDNVDILINNAGVLWPTADRTEDGLEMTMGINYYGHFLLTNLLLEKLKFSAPSRIINVASEMHRVGKINFEQVSNGKDCGTFQRYADSKLAVVLFTRELANRLIGTNVTVNCCHPGCVATTLSFSYNNKNKIPPVLAKWVMANFFKSPSQGARTTLKLALDQSLDNVSGKYFSECKEMKPAKQALDKDMAKKLWEMTEEVTLRKAEEKKATIKKAEEREVAHREVGE